MMMTSNLSMPSCLLRDGRLLITAMILFALGNPSLHGADDGNSKSAAAIQSMHDEIADLTITVQRDAKSMSADLKAEPILHYTDPQRQFPDATLWVWLHDGQPALFSKLERMGGKPPQTQYCMATSQEAKITARWPDGITWKSRRAGVDFKPIELEEEPQKSEPLRLVQLRKLARRFRGRTSDRTNQPEEMRMLTQPILRYSSPTRSLIDGAVFALTSNGTNPDGLLLIQVRQSKGDKPTWEYGCLGMSGDEVSVELDSKQVYQHPGKSGPGDHGYWLWTIVPTK